jgi:glycosyltransferase involved in cell wall biosynthesis
MSEQVAGGDAPWRVSVVIPTRDAAGTIRRAIDSVLAQTRPPFEVIIVDDCSRDDTVRRVEAIASPLIRIIRLDAAQGAAGARNAGIAAAAGELVAFLDADDAWLPAKLEQQVALIAADRRFAFVACASQEFAASGADLGDTFRGRRPMTGPDAWKGLLACNTVATPTVLVWRRHLLALGGFDRALKIGEDQDMWIRLALLGEIGFVEDCLVHVYARANSLSDRGFREHIAYTLRMVERHVAELGSRLAPCEVRAIRGERLGRIGRIACEEDYRGGAGLVLRAALLGYRPVESLAFVLRALPPVCWLKRRVKSGLARGRAARRRGVSATAGVPLPRGRDG